MQLTEITEITELNETELKYLLDNFSDASNSDLMSYLKINRTQLYKLQFKYKLKKSKDHKSKMISKRNKMVTRDLTFDTLQQIAKKYKTRGEFIYYDNSAYTTARIAGILDTICNHMINQSYSMPQLIMKYILDILLNRSGEYNTRKIISPLEIDLYYSDLKLAFEYDGKNWHIDNTNDNKKDRLCIDKNIILIRLIENSRKYEQDIKNQIILNLDKINKISNLNIIITDVNAVIVDNFNLFKNILDMDEIKNTIAKYEYYHDFITKEPKLYAKLFKMKIIGQFTKSLKPKPNKWNEDNIKLEVAKYEYLNDFILNSQGCYLYVLKHKLKHLLISLKLKEHKWTVENIKLEVAKYEYLHEFMKNSNVCYCIVMANKINYLLKPLKKFEFKWNETAIKEEISKYTTLYDFRKKSPKCYGAIIGKKLNHLLIELTSKRKN